MTTAESLSVVVVVVILRSVALAALLTAQRSEVILVYHVTEESVPGLQVGRPSVDARLTAADGHSGADAYRYLLLPSVYAEHFAVDSSGATLKTSTKALDRDAICPAGRAAIVGCLVTLDLYVAQGAGSFQMIKVRISVEDMNDNAPVFRPNHFTLFLRESDPPGSSFPLPVASDADSGRLGVVGYLLSGGGARSSVFRLDSSSAADQPRLILRERLDRETEDRMVVQLSAFDGGDPPKTGSLDVTIIIQDVNDNPPAFDRDSYSVTVDEGRTIEGPLIRVTATDPDEGDNGRLGYGFDGATVVLCGDSFSVDNSTGEIFVRRRLDFEQLSSYSLVVVATDFGPGSLSGSTTVSITVNDINDNAPRIYVWGRDPSSSSAPRPGSAVASSADVTISVEETAFPGSFLAQIYVTDDDSGSGGLVSCRSGTENFTVSGGLDSLPGLFELTARTPIDREAVQRMSADVICTDDVGGDGLIRLTSSLTVSIEVDDVNDNKPLFTSSEYSTKVAENTRPGTALVKVQANDLDLGENARVTYHLGTDYLSLLGPFVDIDGDTGVVSAAAAAVAGGGLPLDREAIADRLDFWVMALDHGTPQMTSSVKVTIEITDINDEKPVFSQERFIFSIRENLPVASAVGTVAAVDLDLWPFNVSRYSVSMATEKESVVDRKVYADVIASERDLPFVIDDVTGRIATTKTLDREAKSSYGFYVIAANVQPPYLNSSAYVTVDVDDVNDNAPTIESTSPSTGGAGGGITVSVAADLPVGSTILRIRADDRDDTEHLRYSLSSFSSFSEGDDHVEDLFHVDHVTGDIRLASTPLLYGNSSFSSSSSSSSSSFALVVTVSDGGVPPLTVNTTVIVTFVMRSDASLTLNSEEESDSSSSGNTAAVVCAIVGVTLCVTIVLLLAIIYTPRTIERKEKEEEEEEEWGVRGRSDAAGKTFLRSVVMPRDQSSCFNSNQLNVIDGCHDYGDGTLSENEIHERTASSDVITSTANGPVIITDRSQRFKNRRGQLAFVSGAEDNSRAAKEGGQGQGPPQHCAPTTSPLSSYTAHRRTSAEDPGHRVTVSPSLSLTGRGGNTTASIPVQFYDLLPVYFPTDTRRNSSENTLKRKKKKRTEEGKMAPGFSFPYDDDDDDDEDSDGVHCTHRITESPTQQSSSDEQENPSLSIGIPSWV